MAAVGSTRRQPCPSYGLVRSSGTSIGRTLSVTLAQVQLAVSITSNSRTIHVRAAGELDLATAPQLAADLAGLSGDIGTIELDLAGVTFIDLAGLRTILEARSDAEARGQQLRILVPGRACARLLELTRTTAFLCAD